MIMQKVDVPLAHLPHTVAHNTSREITHLRVMEHVTITIIVHVIVIIIRVNPILITHPCFEDYLKKRLLAFLVVVVVDRKKNLLFL